MDIRSIQKTGDMYYLYLPKIWCKENKITPGFKVTINYGLSGRLSIFPKIFEEKQKNLVLNIEENDQDIIQKLIVACYINPLSSFRINLEKNADLSKILDQKKKISLESIEIDKNEVICDSIMSITNPASLLKTMLTKIKNMISLIMDNYDKELIDKYEEEIDKSRILIEKAAIDHFTFIRPTRIRSIDLHYISCISKTLENIVDQLILISKKETKLKQTLLDIISSLHDIIENLSVLDYKKGIQFIKKVNSIEDVEVKDLKSHQKHRIKQLLMDISETVIDWAITKEIEKPSSLRKV